MRNALTILILIGLSAGWAYSRQLGQGTSVEQYFESNKIVAKDFYAAAKLADDIDNEPLTGDIYEFDTKSTKRAFFYSLLLPGAGEYYAGSRIRPFVFLGIEAIVWSRYFYFHSKGNSGKKDYQNYADSHYDWTVYRGWWANLDSTVQDSFSHDLPWDDYNNTVIRNHEYYENIGKYDQFQMGWDDIDDNAYPPPFGDRVVSPMRETYLEMRKTTNDYYQNANTWIMVSLGNHLISAFDAALTAKKFNKGHKRFSFKMKTKDFGNGSVPLLTCTYKF
jgi:hypothetical protein